MNGPADTFHGALASYYLARAQMAQANATAADDEAWPPLFETERQAVARLIPAPVRFREDLATKLALLRQWVDEEAVGGPFTDDRVRALARQVSSDFADLPEPPTVPTRTDQS